MTYHGHRWRWMLLGALWLLYFSFGLSVFSIAALVDPIREDLGLSNGAMGAVLGAWPLVYLVAALPAGALVDRLGLRWSLAAGGVIIAASALLRVEAGGLVTMYAAVAVFGLGGPLISVGAPKLVSVWFQESERPTAMGITMTGPAIGGVVALAATNSVLMPAFDQNWRTTLLVYGFVAVAVVIVWLAAAGVAERVAPAVDRDVATGGGGLSGAWELLGQRSVRITLLMAFGVFFYSHALNGWLPTVIEERGFSTSVAGYLAGMVSGISIAGALLLPRFTPERWRVQALSGVFALFAVAAVLLVVDARSATLVSLVIIGLGKGGAVPLALIVMMHLPGVAQRNMGAAGGLLFTAGEAGGVSGPWLFGLLSGEDYYTPGVVLIACVIAASAVTALALRSSVATESL